jgi:hypothetical protein
MKRRVRNPLLFSILLAVCCLCCGGCGTDSAQRLALLESVVQNAQAAVKVATEQVTLLQGQLAAAQQAGADSTSLASIRTALDDAMTRKPKIEAFLATAQADLEKAKSHPGIQGEVELYASILVSAFGLAATAWYKRKAGQNLQATTEIVQAVETLPPDVQTQVKAAVGESMATGSASNAIVDAIKKV